MRGIFKALILNPSFSMLKGSIFLPGGVASLLQSKKLGK
jgi:hypothetical protein